MAVRTMKVAVSLPAGIHASVEAIRRELGVGRSQIIVEALHMWLRRREERDKEEQYVEGYRRRPEREVDLEPLFRAGLSSYGGEKW